MQARIFIILTLLLSVLYTDNAVAGRRRFFARTGPQFFNQGVQPNSVFQNIGLGRFPVGGVQGQRFISQDPRLLLANQLNQQNLGFNLANGLTANRSDLITGNSSFFNSGFLVDARQGQASGFQHVRKVGNDLIEVDDRGLGQRIFIGANGELIGGAKPPLSSTVQELKELYLLNRDKFQGNARAQVDRFLARQGALSNGIFKIDLDDFAMKFEDKDVKDVLNSRYGGDKAAMRRDFGLASLNYLVNTLQGRLQVKFTKDMIQPDGTINVDLSSVLRGEALALLNIADPTSACTGKIRLNRLVQFAMDPANYYKILNVPKTRREVAAAYGIFEDKSSTNGNKVIVGLDDEGKRESGVASGEQRVLEFQPNLNIPGRWCYRSLDTIDQNAVGSQTTGRSVKHAGINFVHDAEEWLCLSANGFMQGYLFSGDGNLLQDGGQLLLRAPAEIASGQRPLGPSIRSVASCLGCHADGFIGGGPRVMTLDKKPYTDYFTSPRERDFFPTSDTVFTTTNQVGQVVPLRHRDFFTSNSVYYERAKADSKAFRDARIATGSEFTKADGSSMEVLPTLIAYQQQPLKGPEAALELGLGESPEAAAKVKALFANGKEFIQRDDFEAQYCNMLTGSGAPQSEIQRDLILRQQQQTHGF